MSAIRKEKKQAPNWTTYFTKLERDILFRIQFYANNPAQLSFASQEKIASDCNCSRMSVYRTTKKAQKLGLLENQTKTKVSMDYKTGLVYFKKRLAIKWLGAVVLKQSEAFISLNVTQNVTQNVTLYNKKRNSSKEERRAPFSLEKRIEEELKNYPESLRESFKSQFEAKYENKRRFIPIDFKEQIERFKRHNPLKSCYKCKDVHFESSSLCLKCTLEAQEKSLQGVYRDLGVKDHVYTCVNMIEEPVSPKLKELMAKMDEVRKRKS